MTDMSWFFEPFTEVTNLCAGYDCELPDCIYHAAKPLTQ